MTLFYLKVSICPFFQKFKHFQEGKVKIANEFLKNYAILEDFEIRMFGQRQFGEKMFHK